MRAYEFATLMVPAPVLDAEAETRGEASKPQRFALGSAMVTVTS
jgi:hypothetical protein